MMKRLIYTSLALFTVVTVENCKSIDRTKVGEREVIVSQRANITVFTLFGAPAKECIRDLDEEGITEIRDVRHEGWGGFPMGTKGVFSSSRLSSTIEYCKATGVK